jgi:hypothetical protein
MALSVFDDKQNPPGDQGLKEVLGPTADLWISLKESIQSAHGPLAEEWNYSGKAYGWGFRLKQKKRALIYMTPCEGYFLASFALGEKACAAARDASLPASLLDLIEAAPRYAEGRGVRIPVRNREDLESIRKLASIKAAN